MSPGRQHPCKGMGDMQWWNITNITNKNVGK